VIGGIVSDCRPRYWIGNGFIQLNWLVHPHAYIHKHIHTVPFRTMSRKPADILAPKVDFSVWLSEPPIVGDWARKFYKEYVSIADEEELNEHLMEVRGLAWEVYKYRCVASFQFINYNLSESYGLEWYNGILQRLKEGDKILDLGCAFGHTARNLVYDGAPQENIISGDLREGFWELGYQLFRDRDKFHCKFHQGDAFDSEYLQEYNGKINIVHISSFFHLFELDAQQDLVRRLLKLVSTKPGTIIFGRSVGNTQRWVFKHPFRPGQCLYQHSEESFRAMFEGVAGDGWDLKVLLRTRPENVAENGGLRGRLRFIITKL
jgi:SAM-dependent methyltransferase